MRYVYYDLDTHVVSITPEAREDLGKLIGTCDIPAGMNVNFLIHNLLANAGYRRVSSVTIQHIAGPANKD